jgi:3-dehydroquinate dehydratase-2
VELRHYEANGEGQLIDQVHAWRGEVAGVVVNAGAYSHTSLALRDAFSATSLPFVEVHLSNIHAREPERRHSMLASAAVGMVCGLGADGYEFALRGLVRTLRSRP